MKVTARQRETVDMICHRHYGKTAGVTEAVMNANPGIADMGVFLPHGIAIEMPDQVTAPAADTVQLWD
ncbi:phage tail protein [Serratia marcescens]|uniref:Phage tail protein n=1 Tax=Serratia marcescens TaxID=615 RepID=A0A5C7CK72_SERMA|nr:tail protein X [Serratia marcescens]TXE33245.1 phage tail protein [Serratia marcescens]TXE65231.1 phage tail protein [Serratia marcescens]